MHYQQFLITDVPYAILLNGLSAAVYYLALPLTIFRSNRRVVTTYPRFPFLVTRQKNDSILFFWR